MLVYVSPSQMILMPVCSGGSPPPRSLQSWVTCCGLGRTPDESTALLPHDIYALGTQENSQGEKEWTEHVKATLHSYTHIEYKQVSITFSSIVLHLCQNKFGTQTMYNKNTRFRTRRKEIVAPDLANSSFPSVVPQSSFSISLCFFFSIAMSLFSSTSTVCAALSPSFHLSLSFCPYTLLALSPSFRCL